MHLCEQRDAVVGEPVDEPDLPERPATIEGDGDEVTDNIAEFTVGAGAGEANPVEMEVEVEVFVLHHDRTVESERDLTDGHRELRDAVDATGQRLADVCEFERFSVT